MSRPMRVMANRPITATWKKDRLEDADGFAGLTLRLWHD